MPIVVNKQLELEKTKEYRLSIQADLNGFSFSVVNDSVNKVLFLYQSDFSCEKGHYDFFIKNTRQLIDSFPLLSSKFRTVNIIFDTCKYALIPKQLYKEEDAFRHLSELHKLDELDEIDVVEIPSQEVVILFAVDSTFINCIKKAQAEFRLFPSIYPLISQVSCFQDYNKIFFRYHKGQVHIIAVEGSRLVYCNSFPAIHFNTALYFLLLAQKQVQFNPEITTVYVSGNIKDFEVMDISKYFSKIKYFRNSRIPLGSPDIEMKYSCLIFDL
ncbi:MAG: DUF3822 family protein [Rikenellaceae bacterium]